MTAGKAGTPLGLWLFGILDCRVVYISADISARTFQNKLNVSPLWNIDRRKDAVMGLNENLSLSTATCQLLTRYRVGQADWA